MEKYKEVKEHFGARLKELRERKNLTQEELATAIGKTEANIITYEAGQGNPLFDDLINITKALGVSMPVFFETFDMHLPS